MVNFYFEDYHGTKNFTLIKEINSEGLDRFTFSPLFSRLHTLTTDFDDEENKTFKRYTVNDNIEDNYVISVGVNNTPFHWAGGEFAEEPLNPFFIYTKPEKSLFDFLNSKYLTDLKDGKAFLLIDSSLEGYHEDWIFNFFHQECDKRGISPNQIIFVSGNSIVEEKYTEWLDMNPKKIKINPLPYSHFEYDVYRTSHEMKLKNKLPTFQDHIEYKTTNEIKLFNNLNRKAREHRSYLYIQLFRNKLLDSGLVSMNEFDNNNLLYFLKKRINKRTLDLVCPTLPALVYSSPNTILKSDFYVNRILTDVYLDTWLTVVSETGYNDADGTVFLSEKLFKPISCTHPFIVVGNKHSLVELKKLGYETFSNWIDESYDNEPDKKRIDVIIDLLKDLKKIRNKMSFFMDMEEVLKHNYRILERNAVETYPYAYNEIVKIVNKK
jgi:hypothetical protein